MNPMQKHLLGIYSVIAEICNKHNLKIYAISGTLLGAVRHGGFIPWDDDIDVALSRPDYDKFVSVVQNELPSNLKAVTYLQPDGTTIPTFFCQIKDTTTDVILKFAEEEFVTHLWIDIFPLDAMPTNSFLRSIQKYKLLYRRMKTQFSMYEQAVHQHRPNRPIHEKALMRFREITHLGSNWSTTQMFADAEAQIRKYDYENEEWVVNYASAYKFREMFPKSWLGEGVMLPFEDTEIRCPSRHDLILTQVYGDYMVPIDKEYRESQHCMEIRSSLES